MDKFQSCGEIESMHEFDDLVNPDRLILWET